MYNIGVRNAERKGEKLRSVSEQQKLSNNTKLFIHKQQ